MAYEAKPGDGVLFKNENKTEDKHPSAKGYILAHRDIKKGEKLDLAAWTKEGAKGKFQSLKMSDSRKPSGTQEKTRTDDDGIPGL